MTRKCIIQLRMLASEPILVSITPRSQLPAGSYGRASNAGNVLGFVKLRN